VVRLTNERDMVFLYHMRMTEEEYRWYLLSLSLSLCLFITGNIQFHFRFLFLSFLKGKGSV